ncbi:alpha/beta hydrolase [Actinoplanes sp. NPDC051475]|uniref:alpha/beta fold hydrolase n=1 Tax=Actinoplanes sp. NPDC051475 TaxID=3157225 RepID=UPI00344D3B2B
MQEPRTPEGAGVTLEGLDTVLDDDYDAPSTGRLEFVTSADGTRIAVDVSGSGPAVMVIGGGLNDRFMFGAFAQMLSEQFTVYNYDRRGRGDSGYGDPDQYTIEREIDDLRAVVELAGEPALVFANCTGGIIAVHAAASGVPIAKLAMYEPPYNYPKITPDQMARLKQLLVEDRREEAVTLFGLEVVGFLTPETLDNFKQHPAWKGFEANARSTLYDSIIDADHSSIPFDLLPKITVPTFILCGAETAASIRDAMVTLSEEIADAELVFLEGEVHVPDQRKCAPLVTNFFLS